MTDEDGELRTFKQFAKVSTPIIGQYQQTWLKTEYDTAVIRARQAGNFKKFERDADLFPNLTWLPSSSVEKRSSHQPFYGIVKPINDPFWSDNYPGDLWNCKCGIGNTDKDADKKTPTAKYDAAEGLDENPAFTGSLFSESHPYVQDGYKSQKELTPIATKQADKTTK